MQLQEMPMRKKKPGKCETKPVKKEKRCRASDLNERNHNLTWVITGRKRSKDSSVRVREHDVQEPTKRNETESSFEIYHAWNNRANQ